MNERIVDLYEQASSFASEEENPTKSYKDRVMIKFAQLIVQECIGVPYAMWDQAELNADVAVKIEHRIRDHFGMEV